MLREEITFWVMQIDSNLWMQEQYLVKDKEWRALFLSSLLATYWP